MDNTLQTYDILIKNTSYLDENFEIQEDATIAIGEGRIRKLLPSAALAQMPDLTAKEVIDGKDLLWMPGLIDGHTHTAQQLLKGAVLDALPMIWTRIMLPFESTLTPAKMRLSAGLAALEMIKSGTTGFVDAGGYYMEEAGKVYLQSGLRGVLAHSSMDQGNFPDSIRQTTEEVLASQDELYDAFHKKGNLKVFYSLRALMNCSAELITKTAKRAVERDTFLQAHMNEYAGEVNYALEKFKLRPVEYVDSLHALNERFVAAHGIMLSPHERFLLEKSGSMVVHCPFSNSGKGIPNAPELMERGICNCLGTDGAAHGGLSLWNEMKIFRSVMNAFWGTKNADPAIMPAKAILKMATANGARILREPECGALKEGFRADLISINFHQYHLLATNNKVNTLLECVCASDVSDSIVEGKLLMRNRQVLTLDEEQLLWEASQYFKTGDVR